MIASPIQSLRLTGALLSAVNKWDTWLNATSVLPIALRPEWVEPQSMRLLPSVSPSGRVE